MNFAEYQQRAAKTDQQQLTHKWSEEETSRAMLIPLLGLAGEVGELVSEYKKRLRDGESYSSFPERIGEELGDLLWYLTNTSTKFGLALEDIAADNLKKVEARWASPDQARRRYFDESYPPNERLPRQMEVTISSDSQGKTQMFVDGKQVGNDLTDNRYDDDDYRFHDVFHLAYMAVLGWSPVMRRLLRHKRKSQTKVDEVEDGGRASVIEEGIAAMVFSYAEGYGLLKGARGVSHVLLRTIKRMTDHLEVKERTEGEWEQAIMLGFGIWHTVRANGGGRLQVDLEKRSIEVIGQLPAPASYRQAVQSDWPPPSRA